MTDYVLEGPKWATPTITYSFATSNIANQNVSFTSFVPQGVYQSEIMDALARWSAIANIEFVQVSDSTSANIRFGYGNYDGPFGTLGVTWYSYDSQNHFRPGSQILFDQGEQYSSTSKGLALQGGTLFESVALHEIGHALGLDHYNAAPAIMNSMASANVSTFTQSDIDGIQALYGSHPSQPAATDFNAHAEPDLLFRLNGTSTLAAWKLGGSTGAQIVSSGVIAAAPGSTWHIDARADFNHDGHTDILWRNDNNALAIWSMDGATNTDIKAGTALSVTPGSSWQIAGTGDFNGDGNDDILWRNDVSHGLAVWTMGGPNGDQIQFGNSINASPGSSWHIVGNGDFDGDHHADILWQQDGGQLAVWLMGGPHGDQILASSAIGYAPGHVVGNADFSGDGRSDILFRNDNGALTVWTMQGNQVSQRTAIASNPGVQWHVEGTGDYNGNGTSDILWRHDSGGLAIWGMGGADGAHILTADAVTTTPGTVWQLQAHFYDLI